MVSRFFYRFLVTLVTLALLAFTMNLGSCARAASGKPVILCSIFAYYDAARAIADDKLDVQILLPVSASPHEYESTVNDKVAASKAALYIKNGLNLDDRFDKLLDDSKARVVTIGKLIPKEMFLTTQEI